MLMRNKIITLIFCLTLAVSTVAGLLVPDQYYSENEKRILTQKDAISLADFPSGKMGAEVEKYLSDQFPLRDGWITVRTLVERLCGKTEISNVYFARDGYLIDAFTEYDQKRFSANIEALVTLSETLKANDIPMQIMLVPTSAQILADKLPAYAPNLDQKALLDYAASQGLDTVDCSASFRNIKTNTSIIKRIITLRALARITAMPRGGRSRKRRRSRFRPGRVRCYAMTFAVRPITR